MKKIFTIVLLIAVILSCSSCTEIKTINILKQAKKPTEEIQDIKVGDKLDMEYATDFTVSNVFSHDMVVQRGEHIRVWGTAPESENGKKISGEFMGLFAECAIENGSWILIFTARLEASCELGHSMRIYTDTKTVVFEDVLVGDVYMVIGQSNVAYSVQKHWSYVKDPERGGTRDVNKEIPIRLHYNSLVHTQGYPKRGTDEVCPMLLNKSSWEKVTLASVSNFTALGYFFALEMVELTNSSVPVGIIEIDGNGQPLGAFMCNTVAEQCRTDTYDDISGYHVTTGVNGDAGRYMYNHYIYPFEKYAIAGIVWYQGESDFAVANSKVYAKNFSELMTYMRGTHNLINKEFPVYIIEFPANFDKPKSFVPTNDAPVWASMDVGLIRATMGSIPQYLSNCYISASSDLWYDNTFWNNLHPNCKFEQGVRAARIAASHLGIIPMEEAAGPILKSVKRSINGKKIVLTYDNVGEGLKTYEGVDYVDGFGIIDSSFNIKGPDTIKLEACITSKNQITITSSVKITGIVYNYIRYNSFLDGANLCNSNGIPASAVLFVYVNNTR
ncbi:MAG: sialate O-acetylesterase [Ruminococcaceae bacterium]|nr:sialate O-acetylesterase [Oscillospiraceae bacterium]